MLSLLSLLNRESKYINIRYTVGSVSVAKKTKEDVRHTRMLFTGTVKFPNSAFCISKTTKPISTKFILFLLYIYTTSRIQIKEIASVVLEIYVPEMPNFLHIFLLHTKLQI